VTRSIYRSLVLLVALTVAANPARAQEAPKTKPSVVVTIKSVKLDYARLKKVGADAVAGDEDLHSKDRMLIFTLQITNKGEADVTYKTFNGEPGGKGDYASLVDSKQKYVVLADFGDMEPMDVTRTATIKPGQTITDVLVFGRPADGAKPVTLLIPAKNYGAAGFVRVEVKVEPTLE